MTTSAAAARTERLALASLLLGAVAIGFSPIFVRLSEIGPVATAFWRVALAVPILALAVGLQGRAQGDSRTLAAKDVKLILVAGAAFTGDLTCWHWSIKFTSVANATLLANFTTIFVTLGAWLLFRERVTLAFVGGMALALAGAMLLMAQSLNVSPDHVFGDALGLITAVFYASYLLAITRLRGSVGTLKLMAMTSAVTAVLMLPVTLAFGESLFPGTLRGWAILVGLAWISHAAGQGMIAYAFAHLPASFSSVALLLQPAIAAFLGWVLLGEALGSLQIVGALVIFAGIIVARRASRA